MMENTEEKQGVNGMSKKKKVIIGVVLLFAVFLFAGAVVLYANLGVTVRVN